MQIQCPQCGCAFSIAQIKPGRYQPTCKKCSTPFLIQVSRDTPPEIIVRKIKPTLPPIEAGLASQSSRSVLSAAGVEATVDGGLSKASSEATIDASSLPAAASDTLAAPEKTLAGEADRTAQRPTATVRMGGSERGTARRKNQPLPGRSTDLSVDSPLQDADTPERLGGYRILRLLGRGAMGAVYEAKQLSLDRNVALKTIRGRLANSPSALARFTREAYAAAQLTHHNVVQIYDFGQDHGQHFFSMEWVRGGPLSDLIREHGPIQPKLAATYAVQAARGLQFAHRNGMVHRDIKPANLLLNEEGVVKVADLGLVKVPDQPDPQSDVGIASAASGLISGGTQVTLMGTAVGTPAYMAPEQATDAAMVDHRADIYSLGCTLYFLLSGEPPFRGSQVSEVMRQHAEAPPPDACAIGPHVPRQLADIITRSMSKRPDQRYGCIGEMISDLEAYLGVDSAALLSPAQADRWEELSTQYATVPLAPMQRYSMLALGGLAALAGLLLPILGLRWLLLAPSLVVAAVSLPLVLAGLAGRSVVTGRIRQWLTSLSWFDCLVAVVVGLAGLMAAVLLGMLPALITGMILGSLIGAGYHFLVDARLRHSRSATLEDAERFVRDLRISGIDEERLRGFAARYSGKLWKPLFEALFGYDALLAMRETLLADPSSRAIAGGFTLRDRVCSLLQNRTDANRKATDHARLAMVEEQGLKSEGLSEQEAKDRSWQMAAALMDAARIDAAARTAVSAKEPDPQAQAAARRDRMRAMMAEARSGKYAKKRDNLAPLRFVLGRQLRLLAGFVLLAIFAWWANQNDIFDSVRESVTAGQLDLQTAKELGLASAERETKSIGGTSGWAVGWAGLLLVGSCLISGWRMSLLAIPAAGIAMFGPALGIPGFGPLTPWMAASAVALAIMLPGIFLGERKN